MDGHDALTRLLVVYPWTQRYFSSFGNLTNVSTISGNTMVKAHGKKVLPAVGTAIHHLDDVKGHLKALSKAHWIFIIYLQHLADVLVVVLASKSGSAFTPQVQAVWEKFNAVLVAALSHGYF
ncbi:hypothetical protein XELAEV_18045081mg [Xenopus laevis]|uniref:Globin domain-containing protein n=1 Tax=Xenopus laevis TaxID=8355 RepID=A0A974C004_XENLA|nr:hypothetical protein XELAEV_18045081mg [Xenopus laevis]